MPLNEELTFEADAVGLAPAGMTVVAGTWVVSSADPIAGAKSLANSPSASEATILRTTATPQADMRVHLTFRVNYTNGSNYQIPSPLLRASADAQDGYLFVLGLPDGSFSVFKKVAGVYTVVAGDAPGTYAGMADGDEWHVKCECEGTAIRWRVWRDGTAEPAGFQAATDGAVTAAGTYGVRVGKAGSYSGPAVVDDLRASEPGFDYLLLATAFAVTGPTNGGVGVASANFTVTPDSNYIGTITPGDGGAGGTFSPASLTWAGENEAKTFTYTPATAGARTITYAALPLITPPANIVFNAFVGVARLVGPAVISNPVAPVGYRVLNANGTEFMSRNTAGVVSDDDTAHWADVTLPAVGKYVVKFDDTVRKAWVGVDYGR